MPARRRGHRLCRQGETVLGGRVHLHPRCAGVVLAEAGGRERVQGTVGAAVPDGPGRTLPGAKVGAGNCTLGIVSVHAAGTTLG